MFKLFFAAAAAVALIVTAFVALTMEHHWKSDDAALRAGEVPGSAG